MATLRDISDQARKTFQSIVALAGSLPRRRKARPRPAVRMGKTTPGRRFRGFIPRLRPLTWLRLGAVTAHGKPLTVDRSDVSSRAPAYSGRHPLTRRSAPSNSSNRSISPGLTRWMSNLRRGTHPGRPRLPSPSGRSCTAVIGGNTARRRRASSIPFIPGNERSTMAHSGWKTASLSKRAPSTTRTSLRLWNHALSWRSKSD